MKRYIPLRRLPPIQERPPSLSLELKLHLLANSARHRGDVLSRTHFQAWETLRLSLVAMAKTQA